jgi:hypothetical protein
MERSDFDEVAFFRAVQTSGARALLIGRRALVLLGLPVLTVGLVPSRSPEEARRARRYAVQNDEHVDVLVARSVPTVDGRAVEFDALWRRRQGIAIADDVTVNVPSIDDLILTKQVASRPRDLEDIRLLNALRSERSN